jgi:hypothetical protein
MVEISYIRKMYILGSYRCNLPTAPTSGSTTEMPTNSSAINSSEVLWKEIVCHIRVDMAHSTPRVSVGSKEKSARISRQHSVSTISAIV